MSAAMAAAGVFARDHDNGHNFVLMGKNTPEELICTRCGLFKYSDCKERPFWNMSCDYVVYFKRFNKDGTFKRYCEYELPYCPNPADNQGVSY